MTASTTSDTRYSVITVARADLYTACKFGIMAIRIGREQCQVAIKTERLPLLTVAYSVE